MLGKSSVLLLIAVCIAAIMDGLDGSIVNICLPELADAFGVDTGTISWVVISYLLMVAGTIFIFGNLASNGHMKKVFIIGFFLFTIASVFCGTSFSLIFLICARIAQGIGASMIIACAPIICVKYLPTNILGFSMGLLTAVSSIAFALGPAVGGIIVQFLSWNWIFWINIPIGIFAIIYIILVIPKDTQSKNTSKFDMKGAILIFISMVVGIYTIERLPHLGFTNPQMLISIAITIITIIAFCIVELKSQKPLINIRVFKKYRVNAVVLSFLIFQVIYCGIIYILPFYMSNSLNFDSLFSGLLLLIPPLIAAILSIPISRWSDHTERRGFCIAVMIILSITSLFFAIISPTWNIALLILSLIFLGIDYGLASGPITCRIIEAMPDSEREMGSTIMMSAIYLGAVLGTAFIATVFTLFTSTNGLVISFSELSPDLFMYGMHGTMLVATILSTIGIVLTLVKDQKQGENNQ